MQWSQNNERLQMLPTPSTSHLSFDNVYEPAEDSFLFLDTISSPSEIAFLSGRFHPTISRAPLVLEVGSGSGVVLSFIASHANHLFGRHDVLTLGTDLNELACKATTDTVTRNLDNGSNSTRSDAGHFVCCINGDLASAFRKGCVDVLVFNPPYVPSESVPGRVDGDQSVGEKLIMSEALFRRNQTLLALATDGGVDGMEVTNRLLDQLKFVLNPDRGVAYVLLCAQNKPEAVKSCISSWGPLWSVDTVGSSGKKGGWESLQIVRIARSTVAKRADL